MREVRFDSVRDNRSMTRSCAGRITSCRPSADGTLPSRRLARRRPRRRTLVIVSAQTMTTALLVRAGLRRMRGRSKRAHESRFEPWSGNPPCAMTRSDEWHARGPGIGGGTPPGQPPRRRRSAGANQKPRHSERAGRRAGEEPPPFEALLDQSPLPPCAARAATRSHSKRAAEE